MDGKYPEVTTSGKKVNLTGSARKLKDDAADWHNLILKWEKLNDEGSSIATRIVNLGISKESVKESNIVREIHDTPVVASGKALELNHRELEEECTKLQVAVDKMAHILSKMEKMLSSEKGICELETFQYGVKGRTTPLFQTWPTPQFAEVSSKLYEAYRQELSLKQTILQELAHTTSPDLSMVYLSSWLHQPYLEDGAKLLLESLLIETGHRAL